MGLRNLVAATSAVCVVLACPTWSAQSSFTVRYLSPVPGSRSILPGSNIIIRVNRSINRTAALRLVKTVSGSRSARHACDVSVSDDGCTILCVPLQPFADGEEVTVDVDTSSASWGAAGIAGGEFRFTISHSPDPTVDVQAALRASEFPRGVPRAVRAPMAAARTADDSVVLPDIDVTVTGTTSPGYLFLSNLQSTPTDIPALLVLRNDGTPVFARDLTSDAYDFKLQPNGELTYYAAGPEEFYVMDSTCSIIDSIRCGNGYGTDVHELRLLPNGHWLLLGDDLETIDMSAVVPGGSPNAQVVGHVIQELDLRKNVVFQWRTWDHFKITDAEHVDLTAPFVDYVHCNALELDADGNILLSSRHFSEITKIDRTTGAIIWRLGGVNNQFTFVNDPIGFSYQHAVRRLPNGHIVVFDNGNFHDPPFSRAVEYSIDETGKVATLVWQYRHSPDVVAFAMGYVQRLENGNTLIGWGDGNPTVTEVAPDGTKAYEMSFDQGVISYRAYRFNWTPAPAVPARADGATQFSLEQNFPNPFNPSTSIRFTTPAESHVKLEVFNTAGQRVATLFDEEMPGGVHAARFTPTALASGVYFYRLQVGNFIATRSLLYLK